MKIGIIGSGDVGRTLGTAFLKEGNEVLLGTRTVSKPEVVKWQSENPGSHTGTFKEAAAFGDIIVLAVGGSVALEAIGLAGKENFSGKTIIDATNPIEHAPPI